MATDDRLSGARNIGILNGIRKFRDSISVKDRNDYYTFSLTGRSAFNLSLTKLQNDVNVSLIRNGQVIAQSTRKGKKSERINSILETGIYHIRVYQQSGESRYRLGLSATPLSSPEPPPPPPPAVQRFLSTGSSQVGTINPTTGVFSPLTGSNITHRFGAVQIL